MKRATTAAHATTGDGLALEPYCVVGVDVAAPNQFRTQARRRRGGGGATADADATAADEYFAAFAKNFTPFEWRCIRAPHLTTDAQETVFRCLWSCKEAFIKGRGDGLGFEIGRAEFRRSPPPSPAPAAPAPSLSPSRERWRQCAARVLVDGALNSRWKFFVSRLPNGHIVTVARGPPAEVVDADGAFSASLARRALTPHAGFAGGGGGDPPSKAIFRALLDAPSPPFAMLHVSQLVPSERLGAYWRAASGGVYL